jgi:hypothetical protein
MANDEVVLAAFVFFLRQIVAMLAFQGCCLASSICSTRGYEEFCMLRRSRRADRDTELTWRSVFIGACANAIYIAGVMQKGKLGPWGVSFRRMRVEH